MSKATVGRMAMTVNSKATSCFRERILKNILQTILNILLSLIIPKYSQGLEN